MAKNKSIIVYLLCFVCSYGYAQSSDKLRDGIYNTAKSQIGVRELTGRNDGVEVERYLSYVWLSKGQPWCAAFVSWVYGQNGFKKPRSGGCVQLMEQGRTIFIKDKYSQVPQYGDVFFIYFQDKKRVAHTGIVDKWSEDFVTTIEGNTNEAGSREGDGVYRKKRLKRQIYAITNNIN